MTRLLLNSKHDELLIQFSDRGIINGYTQNTIDKSYDWRVTVAQKELNWQLKQLKRKDKSMLIEL